jgi:hypothetical protein
MKNVIVYFRLGLFIACKQQQPDFDLWPNQNGKKKTSKHISNLKNHKSKAMPVDDAAETHT